jgi:membrane protein YqaA with SNARE-associated domain
MLRRFYDWVLARAASPRAHWWLALIAFAEASFFPIPPDLLLVPMALARPRTSWNLALICTAGSVAGGALGYLIGDVLFNQLAAPILAAYHYQAAFAAFQARFATYGLALILIKGLTPIPYKIVTIAAGAARFNFLLFMGASLVTRGGRFFLEAALLWQFGDRAEHYIEKHLPLVLLGTAIALVGGYFLIKYL